MMQRNAIRSTYSPRAHDLWCSALFLAFSLFSFLWPDTGSCLLGGHQVPRGYVFGSLFLLLGGLILLLGKLDSERLPWILGFCRTFYPQLVFPFLFSESILLSAPVAQGGSYDAFFADLDSKVFGFDPTRVFSAAFSGNPVINEIMFGAYFSFYVMLAVTPWIPWLKGDRAEARREMHVFSAYMALVFVFYVFFRVQGPKYFFPDLRDAWYDGFRGGPFTAFFRTLFDRVTLSGSAFPSSHVAVSIMLTVFVIRTERRLGPLYVVLTGLIMTATVYIYAHWVADVVGGVLCTAILLPILERGAPGLEARCARLGRDGKEGI